MTREMDDTKAVRACEIADKSNLIYHPPLSRKRQRATHYRGRSGKPKIYTPEQIMLYKLRLAARALGRD